MVLRLLNHVVKFSRLLSKVQKTTCAQKSLDFPPVSWSANLTHVSSGVLSPEQEVDFIGIRGYTDLYNFFIFYSKVELSMTSDGRTIVCYHPSVEIPYEHTQVYTD